MARFTDRRLRKYRNVTVIQGDAVDNLPKEGTVYYMFNPFDEATTKRLKNRLEEMNLHEIRIVYVNAAFVNVFAQSTKWTIKRIYGKKSQLQTTYMISMNNP